MRAALFLATVLLPSAALAEDGRYQLQRTDGGYARIDTRTGEVSTCIESGEQLVCRMAADERSALMDHIDDLETRIAKLEEGGGLPTDEEIDRAIGMMERFMRGFVGIVRDLDEPNGL